MRIQNKITFILVCGFLKVFNLSLFAQGNGGKNQVVDSLILLVKTAKHDSTKVNLYNELFLAYEFIDRKNAQAYLNKGLTLSKRINYLKGLAIIYTHFGYLAEDQGKHIEALKHYFASLKLFRKIQNKKGEADCYNNIGNICHWQCNYPEALRYHFLSLKIKEKIGDKKGIAASFNNIGNALKRQNDYTTALKYYASSQKLNKELNNNEGLANSYNNIGIIYTSKLEYLKAEKNYIAAFKIYKAIGDKKGIGLFYNNIANNQYEQGRYKESLANFLVALKIREEINDKHLIAFSYISIGNIFIRQGKYSEANDYLQKAKLLGTALRVKEIMKEFYSSLTELNEAKKNYKDSFKNHKLYILYRDSIDNEETRKKTMQTQMNYDFEKKEAITKAEYKKELESERALASEKSRSQKIIIFFVAGVLILALLLVFFINRGLKFQRDNYKLKINDQKIEMVKLNESKSTAELKALQARINPHFLYNSLNSIAALIHELPDQAEEMTIKLSILFRYALNSQESNWVSVNEELSIVQTYLDVEKIRFGKRITFEIKSESTIMTNQIPRFLIQPLVENALKHGLKDTLEGGKLKIEITDSDNFTEIKVYDNGLPFPKEMQIGYGIQSVKDKLQLLYGTKFSINFNNGSDKHLLIKISK